MANIGFIGLGNMGGPMAANLLHAGHTIKAFDLVPAALQELAGKGALACAAAAEAVVGVDVVISKTGLQVLTQASAAVDNMYELAQQQLTEEEALLLSDLLDKVRMDESI